MGAESTQSFVFRSSIDDNTMCFYREDFNAVEIHLSDAKVIERNAIFNRADYPVKFEIDRGKSPWLVGLVQFEESRNKWQQGSIEFADGVKYQIALRVRPWTVEEIKCLQVGAGYSKKLGVLEADKDFFIVKVEQDDFDLVRHKQAREVIRFLFESNSTSLASGKSRQELEQHLVSAGVLEENNNWRIDNAFRGDLARLKKKAIGSDNRGTYWIL